MRPLKSFLNDLRIRASWGKTGNNASPGNYDHLPSYGTVNYSFNNQAVRGLAQTKLGNDLLHWETTTTTNVGFTATAWRNKLTVEFDAYRAYTDGILYVPTIPATTGTATAATMNIAEVSKRGLELTLGYQDKINDLNMAYQPTSPIIPIVSKNIKAHCRRVMSLMPPVIGFTSPISVWFLME
ncbi:Outer membrane cobalamin receptor protein [Sphingobacterium multivorum]|uniref:Outer membrane cobalamin receptor protein n=2 Tax=Sphingobacterium multivorum TaxID=28454 RepID=A0A2X2IRZ8_SPHMU|nr:Outer membrane cobalamin receptor protein [Sphingobacterium multivorum]